METRGRRRQMEISAVVNAEKNIVGGEPSGQKVVLIEILESVQSTVKKFECEHRASREISAKVLAENQALRERLNPIEANLSVEPLKVNDVENRLDALERLANDLTVKFNVLSLEVSTISASMS